LNSLLEITQSINQNLSTISLLRRYEKILRVDLNIGRVMIFSFNQKEWECILESGIENEYYDADELVKNSLSKFEDISYVTSSSAFQFKGFDIVIPVYQNDIVIAYVLIGDIDEEREGVSPTIKHLKFIQTITNVIVVAIENKRLYKESIVQAAFKKELELASKMQAMLIPTNDAFPKNNHLRVASYYSPHSEVGGDYYDFIRLNKEEYGFCIADVSGKGMAAAILMSNFQASLRALFTSKIELPAIINRLNESIMNNAKGEKFITFFIGKYNAKTRKLNYVNAGHNPPVYYNSKTKKTEFLSLGCFGLGMFDDIPNIIEGVVEINASDKVICYTDGLSEAENPEQDELGTLPIEECIVTKQSISVIIETLKNKMKSFIKEQPVSDDVSILGIEFC
jgi:sigma-B regulation protein RsbU (phosphoserine phosphatase)